MIETQLKTIDEKINTLSTSIEKLLNSIATDSQKTKQESKKKSKATKAASIEDVRAALVALVSRCDRMAALEVLDGFNHASKVGDLKVEDYADVIKAANTYSKESAA